MNDSRENHAKESSLSHPLVLGLLGLPAFYILFFILICLDEMVLRTYYFSTYVPLPEAGEDFLRMIYWPLLRLIGVP